MRTTVENEKNKKHTKLSAAFCDIIIPLDGLELYCRSHDRSIMMIE